MNKKLKLSVIRTDGGIQVRKVNKDLVQQYAELMKDGTEFPAIIVFYDGSKYWLADGFHRYHARKTNGEIEVECIVKEGTQREAFLFACGANGEHGLPMSIKEIKEIIVRMLKDEEWGKWSDEKIASIVKCSRSTVFRIRKKLQSEGELEAKTTTKYVDKHGNESEMSVKNNGNKKETKESEDKPTVAPVEENEDDRVLELSNTIEEISKENELLKEKIAVGQWDASEIEKLDVQDMLADLREKNRLLELENKTLRESRDAYQYENVQLIKTVKSLKAKLKKAGIE